LPQETTRYLTIMFIQKLFGKCSQFLFADRIFTPHKELSSPKLGFNIKNSGGFCLAFTNAFSRSVQNKPNFFLFWLTSATCLRKNHPAFPGEFTVWLLNNLLSFNFFSNISNTNFPFLSTCAPVTPKRLFRKFGLCVSVNSKISRVHPSMWNRLMGQLLSCPKLL